LSCEKFAADGVELLGKGGGVLGCVELIDHVVGGGGDGAGSIGAVAQPVTVLDSVGPGVLVPVDPVLVDRGAAEQDLVGKVIEARGVGPPRVGEVEQDRRATAARVAALS
jgi:hypothetical protein